MCGHDTLPLSNDLGRVCNVLQRVTEREDLIDNKSFKVEGVVKGGISRG